MKHSVVFQNSDNHWDNALPLGNGCFGSMVYFEKDKLYIPMNHYEVYYNIDENVLPADILKASEEEKAPGNAHRMKREMADRNQPPEGEPYANYQSPRDSAFDIDRYCANLTGSYPKTGDLQFHFNERLKDAEKKLALYVEDATVQLKLKNDKDELQLDTIIARDDLMLNHISLTSPELLPSFEVELTPQRDAVFPEVEYLQIDKKTFAYKVKHILGKKTFSFCGIIRLSRAEGVMKRKQYGAEILLTKVEKEFYVLTSVFTGFRYKDTLKEGIEIVDGYENAIEDLYGAHKEYWTEFFGISSISIPDKFLEHIYYINQYALDCCSGKDGVMYHHACGLNGLWDIRHPSLWGSMWYWDVNIQAAFAGVFSSNRLDLAKVFSDGLRAYVDLAKKSAHDVHDAGGIAGDYPYSFYYSCWPWCAQYLWYLYEYSLDEEYLEKEAFPLFIGLCEFFCEVFTYDDERGYYSIYPDVSPEQGPLTHDSVITVACVKYLFKFTLEAAHILNVELPILEKCREIMNHMAPYPLSAEGMYGIHFKDSHDAPDNMWIRHPSMLMPLFPIGEFDLESDSERVKILSNTVDFLEEHAEIGIFGGSWIAAAAARLGRGQTAIRILYERGIDHMLRTNGLTAEETERFINYCLAPRQPLYYPCMMEFTGEMLAAVNEMLIQSHNGLIRVFPALPDGKKEYERSLRRGYSLNEYVDRFAEYDAWNTVRFDRLLCKGAFEITASMTAGKLDFIKVYSQKGGKVHITSPFMKKSAGVFCDGMPIEFRWEDQIVSFDTVEGKIYLIAEFANICTEDSEENGYTEAVIKRLNYMKRYIYIGENPETKYQKEVDGFIRDWYYGNVRMQNHTVYKFDFTNNSKKRYSECLIRQATTAEERLVRGMSFFCLGDDNLQFTSSQGYGFSDAKGLKIGNASGPDVLRCDGVQGSEEAEFVIEAPRGQYELLVISGDDEQETVTILEGVNGRKTGGELMGRGQYQCKLIPIVNEADEPIRLRISTARGSIWKMNYLLLNVVKGY